ncbi:MULTISPECIES: DUF2231 domain-containing protein [unclassified Tolypothrix]|uniref:DUF2231 domain-containing protein n=1 Tax=unclassified Tolypothrix TaxID=2649714 RepID=UPI0005EAC2BA|nr:MULTISPECIES: DUF2231 domain-containing protein [unclassified Tolypothrix]BAY89581.1 hypothetical protein NIES3275_15840 [Microchaete diplosiphon NIES-3275]EKF02560.1 hypothetical protein FDUTEX481_06724 [Tolypothrix sp. PCC 7601]MBE9085388.1 DUF2231 domain-containing protein [Tolypothrix sp. LEGE 11397]UYD23856.1 DUF2231 domain-containing protein [Tolypothrix sp. PCC 7712]UYD33919.1 DUF2231 domain-containing protein [Tolypothrix sp. PCC 7601]
MNSQLIDQLGLKLTANGLPYEIPLHPQLVHLTLGLFIIAILFDIAATLFPIEKPIFKFLGLPAIRAGLFDVGWYNLLAAATVTFFTVAAGFFELLLANPPVNEKSAWGLSAPLTMLLHGLGGVLLLATMVGMAVWRGLQRYRWRKDSPRQVQWSYLLLGIVILGILYVHGTLGAQLGEEFGIHVTAAKLLQQGTNPDLFFK